MMNNSMSYGAGNNYYDMLARYGRGGDTELAHINPQEAEMLKRMGGAGTVNPQTGLREFWSSGPGGEGPGDPGSSSDPGGTRGGSGRGLADTPAGDPNAPNANAANAAAHAARAEAQSRATRGRIGYSLAPMTPAQATVMGMLSQVSTPMTIGINGKAHMGQVATPDFSGADDTNSDPNRSGSPQLSRYMLRQNRRY